MPWLRRNLLSIPPTNAIELILKEPPIESQQLHGSDWACVKTAFTYSGTKDIVEVATYFSNTAELSAILDSHPSQHDTTHDALTSISLTQQPSQTPSKTANRPKTPP